MENYQIQKSLSYVLLLNICKYINSIQFYMCRSSIILQTQKNEKKKKTVKYSHMC